MFLGFMTLWFAATDPYNMWSNRDVPQCDCEEWEENEIYEDDIDPDDDPDGGEPIPGVEESKVVKLADYRKAA